MKRKGYTLLEMVISVSLIGIIVLISIPRFKSRNLEYEEFIFELKSDLRNIGLASNSRRNIYKIVFTSHGYKIYKDSNKIKFRNCKKGVQIFSMENKIIYSRKSRSGSPEKGRSIYVLDNSSKKIERITIMLASGRVKSYSEDYNSNVINKNNKIIIKDRE